MTYVSDGSTATYYVLPENARELQDLISHKDMNAQIGEIFRACYRYGECRHSDRLRDARKIAFYAQAEVQRLEALQYVDQVQHDLPVPWGDVPAWANMVFRSADGSVWCGSNGEVLCVHEADGGQHQPKVWERPE